MEEVTFNIYPILKFIVVLFSVVGIFWTVNSLTQVIVNSKKDEHIAEKFLEKFPLVSPEFINKSSKEQNIENNQEIHEINKRIDTIEANQKEILDLLAKLQNKD